MTDKDRLQWLVDNLEWDGHSAYWLPELSVKDSKDGPDVCPPPTLKEFRAFIDRMKAEEE